MSSRTRAELTELLIAEADRDPNLIVGVDFAFSLPAWYLQERQLTPRQLWALLADEALTPAMRQLGRGRSHRSPHPQRDTSGEGLGDPSGEGSGDPSGDRSGEVRRVEESLQGVLEGCLELQDAIARWGRPRGLNRPRRCIRD
jgi:hypothetical protein